MSEDDNFDDFSTKSPAYLLKKVTFGTNLASLTKKRKADPTPKKKIVQCQTIKRTKSAKEK